MSQTPSGISDFRQVLLRWFKKNGRWYPWRDTTNPYVILIAELMLRRTQADQVKPVFEQFIKIFPDPESLDSASTVRVADLVYPLGLNWRTPAFKNVARELGIKYNYHVPDSREALTSLPGVGDYVAGAVLSIAYGKPEWIVDTNVARIFKRYFGLETIREARRDKKIVSLAKDYASSRDPRQANLAILDFAALICTALKPKCVQCPLRRECAYYNDLILPAAQ